MSEDEKKRIGTGTARRIHRGFETIRSLISTYRNKSWDARHCQGDMIIDVDKAINSLREAAKVLEDIADTLEDDR